MRVALVGRGAARVAIVVEDDGPGVADTANLFVPFFTTKPAGSGIGLVLARQIAEAHGGSLVVRNRKVGARRRGRDHAAPRRRSPPSRAGSRRQDDSRRTRETTLRFADLDAHDSRVIPAGPADPSRRRRGPCP